MVTRQLKAVVRQQLLMQAAGQIGVNVLLVRCDVPELIVEIWRDDDGEAIAHEAALVTENNDRMRKAISPNAVRVHTYKAASYLEHAQKNYDFHGWGKYEPSAHFVNHLYTDAEAEEQRQYMAIRDVSFDP